MSLADFSGKEKKRVLLVKISLIFVNLSHTRCVFYLTRDGAQKINIPQKKEQEKKDISSRKCVLSVLGRDSEGLQIKQAIGLEGNMFFIIVWKHLKSECDAAQSQLLAVAYC